MVIINTYIIHIVDAVVMGSWWYVVWSFLVILLLYSL